MAEASDGLTDGRIAVIGLSCRFPDAADADRYWDNLAAGAVAVRALGYDELAAAGVPQALRESADYVAAKGVLADAEAFDAAFFGISPREASLIDPQQRIFLEQAHSALEDAGYGVSDEDLRIGVFAGAAFPTFLPWLLARAPDFATREQSLAALLGSGGDYLTTRVAYKLGLTGPAVTVQTACSSSLVAVHLAIQSLLAGDCDMALAGGVTVRTPQHVGHLYREGGALARTPECRPFDAAATGLVNGCGAGLVVLRRLDDAREAGDGVRAVILGSAINNDGARKQAFTAPNPIAQEQVIRDALSLAAVAGDEIDYVEAHGTGTRFGDAVETAALTRALGARERRCLLGSAKANIGHLDAAAGVAGLIKTILAMEHRTVPPQPHFDQPNPDCRFETSSLEVVSGTRPWPSTGRAPLAGVSSFGFGGTNAHVIVQGVDREEAEATADESAQLLCLQGRSEAAVRGIAVRLSAHLQRQPEQALADVAATLRLGRAPMPWRASLVATGRRDAVVALDPAALAVVEAADGRCVLDASGIAISLAQLSALATDQRAGAPIERWATRVRAATGTDPFADDNGESAARLRVFAAVAGFVEALAGSGLAIEDLVADATSAPAALMLAGRIGEEEAIRWAAGGVGSPALNAPRKGSRVLTVGGDLWPASDMLDPPSDPRNDPPVSTVVRLATFLALEDGAAPFADPVAATVGAAWRGGARCDWTTFQGGRPFRRTALPTYPFARTPTPDPLTAVSDGKAARVAPHGPLWTANWRPLPCSAPAAQESGRPALVLVHEECALALPLAKALSKYAEVTVVPVSAAFDAESIASGAHVVFLCAPSADAAAMKETVTWGRAVAVALGRRAARFDCVGAGLFEVLGGDVACGGGAALHALLTTLRLEWRVAQGRAIDADPWAPARGKLVEAARIAARTIMTPEAPSIVAIRGRQSFARDFLPIESETTIAHYVRPGGVYVLVGGAGGLGLAIARRLAAIDGTLIAIMGRSVDDATQPRLAAAIGVSPKRLLTIALDVGQASSVSRALADVMRDFGGLDGIFHLAGEDVTDAGSDLDRADLTRAFAAKARGAEALVASLPVIDVDSAPRFLAIVSSLTATLGFPGQALYAAANAAAEAIAAATDSGDVRVVAVALDRVEGVGLADPARGAALTVAMAEHRWIEREHRSHGQGYLPGSAAVDLLLAAAAENGPRELEDVVLTRAVPLDAAGNDRLWVRAAASAGGGSVLTLFSDADGGAAGFARARVVAPPRRGAAAGVDLEALAARCTEPVSPPLETEPVVIGPRWRGALSIRAGNAEWLVTAALADAAAGDDYPGPAHPALLDVALSSAVGASGRAGFVPSRYARVALLSDEPLGDRVISHIRLREASADRALFDVTVMRADGTAVIDVEGYELVRAVLGASGGATAARLRTRVASIDSAFDADSAVNAIFAAIEASPHRLLWAASGDLAAAMDAVAVLADAPAGKAGPGMNLGGDTLSAVIGAMTDVLGEPVVAADDDFFALGGDSILALDLVVRLGETTPSGASLTLADLYGAPTPRQVAALIEAMSPPVAEARQEAEDELLADSELDKATVADVLTRFAAANTDES